MAATYTRKIFEEAGSPTELIIPEGYTEIGLLTFCNVREKIKSVVFPTTMTKLPEKLFKDCSALSSVIFQGSNITVIPKSFFNCCRKLTHVVLPSSLTTIEDEAFRACPSLQTIILPESLTKIGEDAFYYCDSLENVTIPKGVKKIGNGAFQACRHLQSVTISEGVKEIGENAFQSCGIHSIDIPDSVTKIGASAFRYSSVQHVTLPKRLTKISTALFYNCTQLQSISIPVGVKVIGEEAFQGCNTLGSVVIPEGVTRIEDKAFAECKVLQSIDIPEGVTEMGVKIFEKCIALKSVTIPESIHEIAVRAFAECESLRAVNIPEGVTKICEEAFKHCKTLKNINLPDSVKEIGYGAFIGCNLDNHKTENAVFKLTDGILIDKANNVIISAAFRNTTIIIPEGITKIGQYAFQNCKSLHSIVFPKSLTIICKRAFDECRSLKDILLPINVTTVGDGAFYDCDSLESVTIENRNIELYDWAFGRCEKLTTVNLPKGLSWTKIKDKFIYSPWGEKSPRAALAAKKAAEEAAAKAVIKVKEDKVRAMSAMAVTYLVKNEFETALNTETEVTHDSKQYSVKLAFNQGVILKIKMPLVLDLEKVRNFTSKFVEDVALIKSFLEHAFIDQSKDDNFISIYVTALGYNYNANIRMDLNSTFTKGGNLIALKLGGANLSLFIPKLPQVEQSIMTLDNNVDLKGEYEFDWSSGKCRISLNKVISAVSEVRLPSVIAEVKSNSFQGCKSLVTISLPRATKVSGWPFGGCSALTEIKLY